MKYTAVVAVLALFAIGSVSAADKHYKITVYKASGGSCKDEVISTVYAADGACGTGTLKGSAGGYQDGAMMGGTFVAANNWILFKMGQPGSGKCEAMGDSINCKIDGTECCPISGGDIDGKSMNFAYKVETVTAPPAAALAPTPAPTSAASVVSGLLSAAAAAFLALVF